MSRRPGEPLRPRDGSYGSMGRGGLPRRAGPLALVAGALLIAILLFVLVLKSCGGGAKASAADCTRKAPAPPTGYAYASRYCVTTNTKTLNQTATISGIPLTDTSASRGLTLFAYDAGKWTPITPVAVVPGTSSVSVNATVPKAFAVLKRASGGIAVLGAVAKGVQPSADAAGVITELMPQVYAPAADGSITGGPATVSSGAGYGTIPSVSEPANNPDAAQAVATILADPNKISAHVNAIGAEADKGNYDGIEIDYPAIDSALKGGFTQFIQALATRLHQSKRQLIVRMPLPRQEGSNWNTFAYDWSTIGKSADLLVMAVERDQSVYRSRVQAAIDYLKGQVDTKKLVLEISPLAENRSDQGVVTTLSTAQALAIAGQTTVRDPQNVYVNQDVQVAAEFINRESGSGPVWTPQGIVSFNYTNGAEQHTVWIENVFSASYKLELAQLFHLGGVAVDNSSADPTLANIWPAVQQFVATGVPTLQQPNPQALKPDWLLDGKALPDAGNRAVITWHTPTTPGPHDLTVIVSDGTMRVATTTRVVVKAGTPPPGAGGTPLPGATSPVRAPTVRPTPTSSR
jgi:hypothetical protein